MRRQQRGRFGWMGAALLLLASSVAAQAELPAVLRDWTDWVRRDAEAFACPLLVNQSPEDESAYACAWPGGCESTRSVTSIDSSRPSVIRLRLARRTGHCRRR